MGIGNCRENEIRDCDLAILTSGNRELSRNRDSGIPQTEIYKESQAVIVCVV